MRRILVSPLSGMLLALGLAVSSGGVEAQQRSTPSRSAATIVIRGQVPTPQVVTVRPRQVPDYDRATLGPGGSGRSFWPSILAGYRVLGDWQVVGGLPRDSGLVALGPPLLPRPPAESAERGVEARDSLDAAARAAAIDSVRRELVLRRSRLDSLERAVRGLDAAERTTRGLGARPGRPPRTAADSARAAEIEALLKELELRRARLDSIEALVRSLGRPKPRPDSTRSARDSTRTRPDSTGHRR